MESKERKKFPEFSSWANFNGLIKRFPLSTSLRAEAFGWREKKECSFEANQSFPAKQKPAMDGPWGDISMGISCQKWAVYNQSPLHLSTSRDESWLKNETSLNTSTHPSNSLFDGSIPLPNVSKAVFTIQLPSTKILMVNSVACKLLSFSSEELCSKKLQDLITDVDSSSKFNFDESPLEDDSPLFSTGNVVELVTRDGPSLPVFLFFKKVDTPQRCVAVAELVDRRIAMLTLDKEEKIVSFDEEVTSMFQYDGCELQGSQIRQLTPAIALNHHNNDCEPGSCASQQRVTGQTKSGVRFPVCLTAQPTGGEGWSIVLWVYSNLSGVVILNPDLTIANCNNLFTTLLFGQSKHRLLKQTILKLLPGFHEDGEYGRERTVTGDGSEPSISENADPLHSDRNLPFDSKTAPNDCDGTPTPTSTSQDLLQLVQNETHCEDLLKYDQGECQRLMEDLSIGSISDDISSNGILGESDLELENEMAEKLSSLNECAQRLQEPKIRLRSSRSDDVLAKARIPSASLNQVVSATSNLNLQATGLQQFPMNRALNVSNLSDHGDEQSLRIVRLGMFAGRGRHRDGADLDVVYKVREARGRKGYCVCIARDPWESAEGGRGLPLHLTVTSSLNSTSMDASLYKESESGLSRPHSASIISQSDDVLTSGEYSEYYTNLQQIGKGAFGYVKMAYKNENGLLVITKFIKKHKVHPRSWVFDPVLQMKVPLELSLLTSLEHPNIVRVVDVFYNEHFFQLVMEKHGAGMDLFEFIDRKPKMDEKLASYIFRQMVSAVQYLQSLGILHRDIKDENVIINEKFHVKLIDFGSATFITPDRLFSTFYGTVEYCSPEVLQGNTYRGPELEVWALGVTLYVLVFGENPFYDVEETIKGEYAIPRAISSQLQCLIAGMLEKDVVLRWDIDRIFADAWVNLPVDPNNYSFQKVVRCYPEEAFPVKYICDYMKDEFLPREEEDDDRTVASSNSFCSLHTIENLIDDPPPPPPPNDGFVTPAADDLVCPPVFRASTPRRATTSRTVSFMKETLKATSVATKKRYSLDLDTLKKLCTEDDELVPQQCWEDPGSNDPEPENYWDAVDEEFDQDSF